MANLNIGFSALATGTADVITATYSPAITLTDRRIVFLAGCVANATTTPTFNPNGLGAQVIKGKGGVTLRAGEILGDCILMYHTTGSYWELLNSNLGLGRVLQNKNIMENGQWIEGHDNPYAYMWFDDGTYWEAYVDGSNVYIDLNNAFLQLSGGRYIGITDATPLSSGYYFIRPLNHNHDILGATATHTFSGTINLNAPSVRINTKEVATQEYVTSAVAGLMDYRGTFDASVNAYPSSGGSGTAGAILKSDFWIVSVTGTLPTGIVVNPGDLIIAKQDAPGNTQGNWNTVEYNIGYTPENAANKSTDVVADQASNVKYPTVKAVYDWVIGLGYQTASQVSALLATFKTDNFLDADSSIQTQLNNRVEIVYSKVTDSTALTGTTANTLVDSITIPANTFTVGDIPRLSIRCVFTGTAGNKTIRLYYNTANTLAGATLFATSQGTSATLSIDMSRMFAIKSTTNTQTYQAAASSSAGDFNAGGAPAEVSVDWTATVYIIIAIQLGNSADTAVVSMIKLTS